jgi:hypothetical protein
MDMVIATQELGKLFRPRARSYVPLGHGSPISELRLGHILEVGHSVKR